jgi:hypothetical protein
MVDAAQISHGNQSEQPFDRLTFLGRFQEIVPLNAGNVLVVEDNEPAAK